MDASLDLSGQDGLPEVTHRRPSDVVALRVKEHRTLHGLTQAALADRLAHEFGWAGDRTVVARIESRKRAVTVDELFLLAAALDTSPVLLLTPADESELMSPTPWRTMTSNRVRAWTSADVRLWEQDPTMWSASRDVAWLRESATEDQFDRLASLQAAIYGVDAYEKIDFDRELEPRQAAEASVLALRWEIAGSRHRWESYIGHWPWGDLHLSLAVLDRDVERAMEAAFELWSRSPIEEVHRRQEVMATDRVETADEAANLLMGRVQCVIDVVVELAETMRNDPQPTRRQERPASRRTAESEPPA